MLMSRSSMVLVHTLDPNKSKIPVKAFKDYSQPGFLPYLECMLQEVGRLDIVWDVYKEDIRKAQTRQNRGAGNHLRVANNTNIPGNWNNFLHCDSNKESLFPLLANAIQEVQPPSTQASHLHTWQERCFISHSRPLRLVMHS